MNNEQFRRLVGANTPKPAADRNGASPGAATPRGVSLGSRQKSSIPMTPRSVGFHKPDFARQIADQSKDQKQAKKFKSYDPKGSKLAEGYVDRARNRTAEEEDERAARIKALEESLKKGEIDQETFDKLQNQIAGGDLSSTHLIKGLDFKLLERIRQGEDVFGNGDSGAKEESSEEEADFDEELDKLAEAEVTTVAKEKTKKKGQLSTAPLNPSKKRTRDQILADMKAARDAAKAKEDTGLGSKFKKIGAKTPGTRIERDNKGREVLIVVDEDGNEKRKVRKTQSATEEAFKVVDMVPDKNAKPLGMEVPEQYRKQVEEPEDEDVNIFDDVGDDYDPLAGLEEEDSEDEETGEKKVQPSEASKEDKASMPPPPRPTTTTEPRNYFKDSKTGLISSEKLSAPSMSDPAIQAAFKKAASLKQIPKSDEDDEEARAKAERLKKLLQSNDRDAEDMDMGFGTSRFEDEEDFEEKRVKLSEWGREDDDDGHGGGSGSKRKRGPKKREGDGNNAADVLRVIEKRRAAK